MYVMQEICLKVVVQWRMKPAGVMTWATVACDGFKSPLVFTEEGVMVLPCITESFVNRFVFIQDGAPSHISNLASSSAKIISTDLGIKTCGLPEVQISTQWTFLSRLSYRVMTGLNLTQVWLLWKMPFLLYVLLWMKKYSTAFMPLSCQSFEAYDQDKRKLFWNLIAAIY